MKKKILLSMALLSAVAGTTPLTSHAAEKDSERTQTDGCYKVYICQNAKSLSQVLKECGVTLGTDGNLCFSGNNWNNGNLCINNNKPDADTPEVSEPDTSVPEVSVPETTNPPVAETPDTEAPDTLTPPVVETPDTDGADQETLSFAEQVVKLVNEERAKAGLSALEIDTDITAAANVRAKEIKQLFSHTRPNGSSFSSALKEQGVSYRGSGENIAWGQKTPEQVMNGWMNSEGHRANILNKNFKNIGVGYYQDANGVNYWVQLFTY